MMCRVVRVFGLIGSGQNKKVFVMSETFSQFLAGCSTKLYSWGLKRFAFWIIKKAYMSIGVSEIYRVTSEIALKELFQKDEIALAQNRDTILTEYAEYLFLENRTHNQLSAQTLAFEAKFNEILPKTYPASMMYFEAHKAAKREDAMLALLMEIKRMIAKLSEQDPILQFAPLFPIKSVLVKSTFQTPFKSTELFEELSEKIEKGLSFRLLGLPGLGKTRMICEALRGKDNDVYFCDCRMLSDKEVLDAVAKLMSSRGSNKQLIILDNCSQKLCSYVNDAIKENGYNCQLITIHYDPSEHVDSGIEGIILKIDNNKDVIRAMVDKVKDMPEDVKLSIVDLSGGFPLMATIMIENYLQGIPIANVSKSDVFNRMLGVKPENATDQDKIKVLTAFSIFKFIGLYGGQEKQGRFIAGNRIITNIRGTVEDNLQLFKEVHGSYQKTEVLERQGNLVLMRLIPLAIYLCKSWFDKQTTESIADLINQIRSCEDEGTKTMLIESLSKRITLLAEVPLAKELNDGLTDPKNSPFLNEEVVLTKLGSRLFLAFSEVNPEACAYALYQIIRKKTDEELIAIEDARRNLSWALDHLAFDKRSFRNAMLTLARFSLVETEGHISNNTTGLFVDRYPILLSGTEVPLMERVDVLKELSADGRYEELIKRSLHRALMSGHFQRSGGAEKQGIRTLTDYVPTYKEVADYYNVCFDMLMEYAKSEKDIDDIANTLTSNARWYYIHGMEDFLIKGLETIAPKKNFIWEDMKVALTYLIDYDSKKRANHRKEEFEAWKKKLTRDDYVYRLLHLNEEINRHYDSSFEEEFKKTHERYGEMAKELIDNRLYETPAIIAGVMRGDCYNYNSYGLALSSYSKEKGIQKEILALILDYVLHKDVSRDGEVMLIYFILNVEDRTLVENTYDTILQSEKKRLLTSIYAIKAEGKDKLEQLFDLLDRGEIAINDFSGYFNFKTLNDYDVKYVADRLLEYGEKGAALVLSHCHNLLFGEKEPDEEYQVIGRKCLLLTNLQGIQMDDYVYMQSMNNYLARHRDEEMALHIQTLMERSFETHYSRANYYIGRLYRKVLKNYTELLKPRLFELLVNEGERHSWIDLLRTSYPEEEGDDEPSYTLIKEEDWFEWLEGDDNNERAYSLTMMFSYAEDHGANPTMVRLIDGYWSDEVRGALSSRFHTFGWTGSGIPLYKSRIAICEDYVAKLKNKEAREWFKKDIAFWEKEIEEELLKNAHERAIYD